MKEKMEKSTEKFEGFCSKVRNKIPIPRNQNIIPRLIPEWTIITLLARGICSGGLRERTKILRTLHSSCLLCWPRRSASFFYCCCTLLSQDVSPSTTSSSATTEKEGHTKTKNPVRFLRTKTCPKLRKNSEKPQPGLGTHERNHFRRRM